MSEPHSALVTRLCSLIGVRYPVVQTGMGWVAGARLVAASAEAGGLGILASATMTLTELSDAIAEVRTITQRPFGVNLRTDTTDTNERLEMMIDAQVKVASFAQPPDPRLIARCKEAGVVVMPTVGALRHAQKMSDLGVDAMIVQGMEGGGHTGKVPTSLLLPQVVDAVSPDVVVIAAGGYFDGRGLVSALAYGASGIAMGTRFLLTKESTVPDAVKARYLAAAVDETVVSANIDGSRQRVIRTELIERLDTKNWMVRLPRALANAHRFRSDTEMSLLDLMSDATSMKRGTGLSWPQVVMAANAPVMTKAALVEGRLDAGVLPSGQVTGLIEEIPCVGEVVRAIVSEASEVLERLAR